MHIPDGFLSAKVWVSTWVIAAGVLGWGMRRTQKALQDRMVPLMGVMAAFIFAAQMINFPVMSGTSGHLLGGTLAAIVLGPWAGVLVLACVLIVQCFIFQDGGLTALGANMVNMAIVGTMSGYAVYIFIRKATRSNRGVLIGAAAAAWFSVVLSSAACALELGFSGIVPLRIVLPAMVSVHAFIGIGEALITALVLRFILRVRPDLLYEI